MLESVTRFIFDNIGNQLSTKKIADTMTLDGRKIDVRAVENIWLTLDEGPEADYEGIRRINALDWLIGKTE